MARSPGIGISGSARSPIGRVTDKVRLTWGLSGLNLIAKERGEFEKLLAKDGIKVEWLGPFPNHAPTLQAVTGGSADFSFGGSTTPALGRHHRRIAARVHAVRGLRTAHHRDHRQG